MATKKKMFKKKINFAKESKEPEKTIVSHKIHTIEFIHFSDGSNQIKRTNKGFTLIELIGMLNLAKDQVMGVLDEKMAPSNARVMRYANNELIIDPIKPLPKEKK